MNKIFKISLIVCMGIAITQCGNAKKAPLPISDETNQASYDSTLSPSNTFGQGEIESELNAGFSGTGQQGSSIVPTAQGPSASAIQQSTNANPSQGQTATQQGGGVGDLLGSGSGLGQGKILQGFTNAQTVPGQPVRNIFRRVGGLFGGLFGG